MAKKDVLTIDTAKASDGLRVFESKKKSFTTAYNAYQGSYLNTGGDSTVRKLNNTVKGIYSAINSLYASLNSYTASYIKSVQGLENSLRNGLIPPDEESDVQAKIAAVNKMLNGADPTDIEINPRTGEVSVNVNSHYRKNDIDPRMNGTLTSNAAKEANRDYAYNAHLAHPKAMTFLDAWTPLPFELGNVAPYTESQMKKIQKIKKENTGARILGTAAGILTFAAIPGGAEVQGAKLGAAALKTGASIGKKELLMLFAKQELKDMPVNLGYAIKEGYNPLTGKIDIKRVGEELLMNVGIDGGIHFLGKAGSKGIKTLRDIVPSLASKVKNPTHVRFLRAEMKADYLFYKHDLGLDRVSSASAASLDQYYKLLYNRFGSKMVRARMKKFYGDSLNGNIDDAIDHTVLMTRGSYERMKKVVKGINPRAIGHYDGTNSYVSVSSAFESFRDVLCTSFHESNHYVSNNISHTVLVGSSNIPAQIRISGFRGIIRVSKQKITTKSELDDLIKLGYKDNGGSYLIREHHVGFDESVTDLFAQKGLKMKKGRSGYEAGVRELDKILSLGIPGFDMKSLKKAYTSHNIDDVFRIQDSIDNAMGPNYFWKKLSPAFDAATSDTPDSLPLKKCVNEIAAKLK